MDSTKQWAPGAETAAVGTFWRWWSAAGVGLVTAAVMTGAYGDLPELIGAMVTAIHPELSWETAPGRRSRHRLCVSGAGDPRLRVLAERWRRAAPPDTPTWEFTAARQAQEGMLAISIDAAGQQMDLGLSRVTVTLNEARALAGVTVYHPAFATMNLQDCRHTSRLLLDWLLGEDDVQRWIGAINVTRTAPGDSLPAADLPGVVHALAQRNPTLVWRIREARTSSGDPVIISALHPLRWINHPLLDLHTAVQFSYPRNRPDGLPDEDALADLQQLQSDLTDAIGSRGEAVASEMSGGVRTLHYYSDSQVQNGHDSFDRFARAHQNTTVAHTFDPGWSMIRTFT